jgi:tRNA pseudouridine13 synthase
MAESPRVNPLPFLTADLPGTGGVLRSRDEDFVVDEEPAYAPRGAGDHVFARIEKRGLTTPQAVQAIARALRVKERDIGVAGMKDRRAVTRQWISLPPPVTPEAVTALALEHITVLAAARHEHKLRTGHLRANRFVLTVRDVHPDGAARARAILDRLAQPPGAPNWYGEQRFGKEGDNAARGRALLAGAARRDRRMDRFYVSALQSELFNTWLAARVTDGLYARVLAGDVLHKVGGGLFTCDDPATDERRLLAGEVVVTGPMFGARMRDAAGDAAGREQAILAAAGLERGAFAAVAQIAEGTRRDASIPLRDVTVREVAPSTLEVGFALPAGAYATAVMREVMKTAIEPVDAPPEAT